MIELAPSTRLLLKLFRWRLILCVAACFVLLFWLVTADGWDSEYPGLAAFFATFLIGVLRLPTRFYRMVFPVSDRQTTWIPLGAMGAAWLAGLAGILAAQGTAIALGFATYAKLAAYWAPWLPALPAVAFLVLLALRALRINSGVVGFLYLPVFLVKHPDNVTLQIIRHLPHYWPFFLAASAFLVWEAPAHWASLRRLSTVDRPSGLFQPLVWNLNGPLRFKTRTLVADGLFGLIGLMAIGALLGTWLPRLSREGGLAQLCLQNPFSFTIAAILAMVMLLLLPVGGVHLYRRHRASGLGPLRAFVLMLARLTLVLYPLGWRLGVGRGNLARCGFCGGRKFVWQAHCPHCDEAGAGVPLNRREARPAAEVSPMRSDPAAFFYRVIIPLQLLLVACFTLLRRL